MAKVDKPEIGAEMYAVFEHLYSNKSAPARSLKEYCVCKGTVRSFYTGSYTDVCMLFRGPEGCPLLSYYKLEDIGKKLIRIGIVAVIVDFIEGEQFELVPGVPSFFDGL